MYCASVCHLSSRKVVTGQVRSDCKLVLLGACKLSGVEMRVSSKENRMPEHFKRPVVASFELDKKIVVAVGWDFVRGSAVETLRYKPKVRGFDSRCGL